MAPKVSTIKTKRDRGSPKKKQFQWRQLLPVAVDVRPRKTAA